MTHDYKAALEFIANYSRVIDMPNDRQIRAWNTNGMKSFVSNHFNEIHRALLIADKLMQEPSEGMIIAGDKNSEEEWLKMLPKDVFKAMRDQLLREIEQEQHQ